MHDSHVWYSNNSYDICYLGFTEFSEVHIFGITIQVFKWIIITTTIAFTVLLLEDVSVLS